MARCFNLMADWQGSGRYRGVYPSVALAALGHEVLCSLNPASKGRDGKTFAATADVFIGHRVDILLLSELWQRLAGSPRTALMVYDLDDNLWGVHPSNPAYGLGFPDRASVNISMADMVTVCSHGLAEIVARNASAKDIRVVPNGIPDEVLGFPRSENPPSIVYPASASHSIDIPILQRVLSKVGPISLRQMGVSFPVDGPVTTEGVSWTDSFTEYFMALDASIGVAPLIDDPFNYGKSDLKIIEYMARGIPFVCSNVGPYEEVSFLHEKAGFFVSSDSEWVDAITTLLADPGLGASMGAFGKAWVESNRTTSVLAKQREKMFGIEGKRSLPGAYGEDRSLS